MRLFDLIKRHGIASIVSAMLLATVLAAPSPIAAVSLLWPVPLFLSYRARVRRVVTDLGTAAQKARAAQREAHAATAELADLQKANATLESDLRYAWRLLEVAEERFVARGESE